MLSDTSIMHIRLKKCKLQVQYAGTGLFNAISVGTIERAVPYRVHQNWSVAAGVTLKPPAILPRNAAKGPNGCATLGTNTKTLADRQDTDRYPDDAISMALSVDGETAGLLAGGKTYFCQMAK